MTTRIFLLTDDISQAETAVRSLTLNGVHEDGISVISESDNVSLTSLPDADLTEKSDVLNAVKRGAGAGAATGLLAGIVAVAFPPSGLVIGGAALAGMTGAGAAIGAWSASLIGVSEQHPLVEKFRTELERGAVLIIADADDGRALEQVATAGTKTGLASDRYGTIQEGIDS